METTICTKSKVDDVFTLRYVTASPCFLQITSVIIFTLLVTRGPWV